MLVKPFFKFLDKIFNTKNKKAISICILILLMVAIYNTLFRYEYKIYNKKSYPQVIKIDKLTGKSVWYVPEYIENK